jgi:hypothetical protein
VAWLGPSLQNSLPGKGVSRIRRDMIPESGVHIDVPKQQAGAWVTTEARGLGDMLSGRWAGWSTEFWEDRYEEQITRCEGALRVPDLDLAVGASEALNWLQKRVFQSFEDSPAGAIAGMMKFFDPSGLELEPGMNDVVNFAVPTRPRDMGPVRGGVRPGAATIYSERLMYIGGVRVTKRLIDIEDELLEAARRELGTTGIADTVRSALQLAATRSARLREIEWLVSGGMAEMADPEVRKDAWR